MLDYTRGYTSTWRVREIDPETWLPGNVVEGIDSVTVKRETGDSAPLLESGEMELTGKLPEGWYRIEALSSQGGMHELGAVATMLFAPDGAEWSHSTWGGKMTGRSVLAPAAEKMFAPGRYAPKGCDGAEFAASLLRECVHAPVRVDGSFELSEHVVFDLGSSYLDGAWAVLNAANWCMQISGDGTVAIMAQPEEPALTLDHASESMLMPTFSTSLPIEDVPNVFRAYDGGLEAEAVNDDPESPTSTVSRGRRIEAVEDSPSRINGETLQACARRRLAELSEIHETMDVTREFARGVLPYSAVRVELHGPDVIGDYRVMAQTITCSHGIQVGETLGRRQAWR